MKAFDTNVLVRVLVGDDPVQTPIAERAFVHHARGDGVFVSLVVRAELGWELTAGYRRGVVHQRLDLLVRTRGVFVEHVELVHTALDGYRDRGVDLADLLILGMARRELARPLLTLDRRLADEDGAELLAC